MKRRYILLIFLVFITGCSQQAGDGHDSSVTHNGQAFEWITYEEEFTEYINKADGAESLDDLFIAEVVDSFRVHAFGEDKGYSIIQENPGAFSTPKNTEALQENLEVLEEKSDVIEASIIRALQKSSDVLSGGQKKVHIFPANPDKSYRSSLQTEVTGMAWNEEDLVIMIGKDFTTQQLERTIAHEYHHTIYSEHHEWDHTLLDAVVAEGKAEVFAEELYPDVSVATTEPLRGRYKEAAMDAFLEYADSTDPYVYEGFMVGVPDADIPSLAVYRIGYKLVKDFLEENPDLSIQEWTDMSPEEVVKGSSIGQEYRER
ncbi:hypothetical protein EQV77_04410 [Halobacillus fulvus]|nr:hypothetical protein EQV77_04410 [Halobacillus fulvus]